MKYNRVFVPALLFMNVMLIVSNVGLFLFMKTSVVM